MENVTPESFGKDFNILLAVKNSVPSRIALLAQQITELQDKLWQVTDEKRQLDAIYAALDK